MTIPDRFIPDDEIRIDGNESLPEIGDTMIYWENVFPNPELAIPLDMEVVDLPGTTDDRGDTLIGVKRVRDGERDGPTDYFPLRSLERKEGADLDQEGDA